MRTGTTTCVLLIIAAATRPAAAGEQVPIAPIGITVEATGDGLRVSRVSQGSPAEIGGIKAGDVVVAFGSIDVRSPAHLVGLVVGAWRQIRKVDQSEANQFELSAQLNRAGTVVQCSMDVTVLQRDRVSIRDIEGQTVTGTIAGVTEESVVQIEGAGWQQPMTFRVTDIREIRFLEPLEPPESRLTSGEIVGISAGVGAGIGFIVGLILVAASCDGCGGMFAVCLCGPEFYLLGGAIAAGAGALGGVVVGAGIAGIRHASGQVRAAGFEQIPGRSRRLVLSWSWSF